MTAVICQRCGEPVTFNQQRDHWIECNAKVKDGAMRMLDQLRDHLDELERDDDRSHRFVQDLLIKQEEGRLGQLSQKQFRWLCDIHDRYVSGR